MSGHVLTCRHCGRRLTAKRSDAVGCSRSCRRHLAKASRDAAPVPVAPLVAAEDLDGWRRLPGGFVIPPTDPRLTMFVDPDELRRL
jgi:hypothetical protein